MRSIARNRARLLALGIPQAVEGLRKLAPARKPKAPRCGWLYTCGPSRMRPAPQSILLPHARSFQTAQASRSLPHTHSKQPKASYSPTHAPSKHPKRPETHTVTSHASPQAATPPLHTHPYAHPNTHPHTQHPHPQHRPKRPAGPPVEPSRQSSRLRDAAMIARGEVPPGVEEGSELALFIIDGECPRWVFARV